MKKLTITNLERFEKTLKVQFEALMKDFGPRKVSR
jgi:hypothetical protein